MWSDAVARTTAVAFGFPGFSGSRSREPSSSRSIELERSAGGFVSGKTPLFRDDRFAETNDGTGDGTVDDAGGSPARGLGFRRRGARAGRRRRRDPKQFFFATGKPSRERVAVFADDAPGVAPRVFPPRPPVPVARLGRLSIGAVVHAQLSERLARALGGGVAGGADTAAGPRRDAKSLRRRRPSGRPPRRRRSAFCANASPPGSRRRRNVVVGVVVALAGEERRARGRRRGRVAGPTAELERDAGDARALRCKVREGRARAYRLLRRVYYHSRRGVFHVEYLSAPFSTRPRISFCTFGKSP